MHYHDSIGAGRGAPRAAPRRCQFWLPGGRCSRFRWELDPQGKWCWQHYQLVRQRRAATAGAAAW